MKSGGCAVYTGTTRWGSSQYGFRSYTEEADLALYNILTMELPIISPLHWLQALRGFFSAMVRLLGLKWIFLFRGRSSFPLWDIQVGLGGFSVLIFQKPWDFNHLSFFLNMSLKWKCLCQKSKAFADQVCSKKGFWDRTRPRDLRALCIWCTNNFRWGDRGATRPSSVCTQHVCND